MKPQLLRALAAAPLGVVLGLGPACSRPREDTCSDASTTSVELPAPAWTFVPPPPPPHTPRPAARPEEEERPLARIDSAPRPDWVPDGATLTVVEAPDLAHNLGFEAAAPQDGGAPAPAALPSPTEATR
jgi:hypothetical protein